MKVMGVAANVKDGTDSAGDSLQLSEADLKVLASSAVGKVIHAGFDRLSPPIGVIRSAMVSSEKLYVRAELFLSKCPEGVFLVPGYEKRSLAVTIFGLTISPLDTNLTPIKEVKNDDKRS